MYPLKFEPFLRPMIWGGEKIAAYKGVETSVRSIGESWELSGVAGHESIVAEGPCKGVSLPDLIDRYGAELVGKSNYERFGNEFPLLVKFIDAREDLSIQVHPDDRLAWERHRMHGKTEMWYVVSETGGASLRIGFDRRVDAETYAAAVADHTICDLLRDHPIAAGDVFFLPAGKHPCRAPRRRSIRVRGRPTAPISPRTSATPRSACCATIRRSIRSWC